MAVHGRAELMRRIELVIGHSLTSSARRGPKFSWACALHAGSFTDAGETHECWQLTTRAGETLLLTREVLLALNTTFPTEVPHTPGRALWLMGAVPCSVNPPAISVDGWPLRALELRLCVGPTIKALPRLHADVVTTIRPGDCWHPVVVASAVRPLGLPR